MTEPACLLRVHLSRPLCVSHVGQRLADAANHLHLLPNPNSFGNMVDFFFGSDPELLQAYKARSHNRHSPV